MWEARAGTPSTMTQVKVDTRRDANQVYVSQSEVVPYRIRVLLFGFDHQDKADKVAPVLFDGFERLHHSLTDSLQVSSP